jgi:hypothetical protein
MPAIVLSAGTLSVSAEGSALGTMACTEVLVQAHPDNTKVLFIGGSANQTIMLSGGATVTLPVSNLAHITARTSAASATVNWIAHTKDW